jgi:hypothetical protein
MIKNVHWSLSSTHYSCPTAMKHEYFQKIFPKKNSQKKINWDLSHFKQTDMMQVIVAFHSFTNAPNCRINFD